MWGSRRGEGGGRNSKGWVATITRQHAVCLGKAAGVFHLQAHLPSCTRLAPLPTQPSRPPAHCHAPFCTLQMDPLAQTLFYIAFTIGLIILWMVWRHFLWAEKFFMQARAVLCCAAPLARSMCGAAAHIGGFRLWLCCVHLPL